MLKTFEKYKDTLDIFLTCNDVLDIAFYCDKKWYTTLLKRYGVNVFKVLLKHFEDLENYKACQELILTVENHNKNFGTNFKLQ